MPRVREHPHSTGSRVGGFCSFHRGRRDPFGREAPRVLPLILRKENLARLFDRLKADYRVIGPVVEGDTVMLGELEDLASMPIGRRDRQGPGFYRLEDDGQARFFSFTVGPDSVKRHVHPPVQNEYFFSKSRKRLHIRAAHPFAEERPTAFFALRACDIAALKLLDKVFLQGPVQGRRYQAVRERAFILAVNCLHPADTCFCHAMHTGPEVRDGFDLALTELEDAFLVEIGTRAGKEMLDGVSTVEATPREAEAKAAALEACRNRMKRSVPLRALPQVLYNHLEHPRWGETAARCLGCGNCTQVCPTCFCTTAHDHVALSCLAQKEAEWCGSRVRLWDSCFSINFARVHGGNFRPSRRARYRHWVLHKLAYWIDQFGAPGCVGCGRCITWCPVGIDVTEELQAIATPRNVP